MDLWYKYLSCMLLRSPYICRFAKCCSTCNYTALLRTCALFPVVVIVSRAPSLGGRLFTMAKVTSSKNLMCPVKYLSFELFFLNVLSEHMYWSKIVHQSYLYVYVSYPYLFRIKTSWFANNFKHLTDTFIQSNLLQAVHLYCQYVCSLGIEPTTFALLTQCSNHWATGTLC